MNHRPIWTTEEEAVLIARLKEGLLMSTIASELKRPLQGVRHKAVRLRAGRLPKHRRWSKIETRRLRQLYPACSNLELEIAFPGRTRKMLLEKARLLGIRREHSLRSVEWVRRIAALSETEAAYIAGMIDGEGSLIRTGADRSRLSISMGSTCPHVIAFFVEKIGGNSYAYPDGGGLGKKPFWRWALTQADASDALLKRMRPYMIIK